MRSHRASQRMWSGGSKGARRTVFGPDRGSAVPAAAAIAVLLLAAGATATMAPAGGAGAGAAGTGCRPAGPLPWKLPCLSLGVGRRRDPCGFGGGGGGDSRVIPSSDLLSRRVSRVHEHQTGAREGRSRVGAGGEGVGALEAADLRADELGAAARGRSRLPPAEDCRSRDPRSAGVC